MTEIVEIEENIVELLLEWFPFLDDICNVVNTSHSNNYVFGDVLREMWSAGCSYDPNGHGSFSLKKTIRYKMHEYFKKGGNLNIYVHEARSFFKNGVLLDLTQLEKNRTKSFKQIVEIISLETEEEMSRLKYLFRRDLLHNLTDHYGESSEWTDDVIEQYQDGLATILFEFKSYKLKIKANIFPELGEELDIICNLVRNNVTYNDLLYSEDESCYNISRFLEFCDFGCNLLIFRDNTVELRNNFVACNSIEDFHSQIKDRKLTVLTPFSEQNRDSVKLIYEMCTLLRKGWKLSDSITSVRELASQLCRCTIYLRHYDDIQDEYWTEYREKQRKRVKKYLESHPVEIIRIADRCIDQLPDLILKHSQYEGDQDDILCYLETLYIKHGMYKFFLKLTENLGIDRWKQSYRSTFALKEMCEFNPESIFEHLTFEKVSDVTELLCNLIRYNRRFHFHRFMQSPDGIKYRKIFCRLDDESKRTSCIFLCFFGDFYELTMTTGHRIPDPMYIGLLSDYGIRFPSIDGHNGDGSIYNLHRQKSNLLRTLWRHEIIDYDNLFPDTNSSCVCPTNENVDWLLELGFCNLENVERMMCSWSYLLHFREFRKILEVNKQLLIANGKTPEKFEKIAAHALTEDDEDSWNWYCTYRDWNDVTISTNIRLISNIKLQSRCTVYTKGQKILKTSLGWNLLKKYGMPLFLGSLNGIHSSTYTGVHKVEDVRLLLVYWLWQAAYNNYNQHAKDCNIIWKVGTTKEIFQKILDYVLSESTYNIMQWDSRDWQMKIAKTLRGN